ncbi:hypothetical protein BB559_000568 [Furculomyces boomerangus]|uniref:ABC transporter domain-containing protein n=2 Tax=Harpellales TaxID=61421 RepID=A0A2T9Z4U0_9FUNG|nr:hypothetical protein BB559_000568 [Furculomyces boomerangus]PWA00935.1 hypothetical protein BB558_002986 [Smittium angustum]
MRSHIVNTLIKIFDLQKSENLFIEKSDGYTNPLNNDSTNKTADANTHPAQSKIEPSEGSKQDTNNSGNGKNENTNISNQNGTWKTKFMSIINRVSYTILNSIIKIKSMILERRETIFECSTEFERIKAKIALELVNDPSMLFIDDPTMGLSLKEQENLMISIRKLQKFNEIPIVMTINNPTQKVLNLTTKIIVLAKGNVVYHGDPKLVLEYLHEIGFRFPLSGSDADYLMECVSIDSNGGNLGMTRTKENMDNLLESWKKHVKTCGSEYRIFDRYIEEDDVVEKKEFKEEKKTQFEAMENQNSVWFETKLLESTCPANYISNKCFGTQFYPSIEICHCMPQLHFYYLCSPTSNIFTPNRSI